jgi:GNAT superfamily N-acetyltransferase
MCDEWMPTLRLRLQTDEFQQLPRHPAYRYEYLNGNAILSPWPRHLHALLDLACVPAPRRTDVRPVEESDEPALVELFAQAFFRVQPFGALDETTLRQAADRCLQRTYTGGDGPWLNQASFVATADDGRPSGAALVTLVPGGDAWRPDAYRWYEPAPTDLWQSRSGQPHLTWIFVCPMQRGRRIGAALLRHVADALRQQGYTSLWTTFLVGNDVSMLWHWQQGFQLARPPA